MALLKCKMCGGQLDIEDGQTVVECDYCGTQQTLPSLDNEKKLNLFNRANRLRMANEFDKAAGVFESIVAEFPEEAEAYWGLVLCKYGIEYVDDPKTGKKIPTCHRTSYESVFDDNNFELALEYADSVAVSVYRNEAKEIDRLQKAILDIASKEDPFDVFICYKETAEDGQRTKDSVMAQDIYDRLTDKGYKVFFARITLEDKLGQEYEPYIFSALNSAKVMLAIGTKYEYYNAVWVKNEWSRYLDLMKKDKDKLLIPCYADIDAYDMPSEFKNLQGQDMNKIGFIQDLIRGIGKVVSLHKEEKVVQTVIQNSNQNVVAPLLKRAQMFLEDENWNQASEYFNKVLDFDPECGDAYAGLFLATNNVKTVNILISMRKNVVNSVKYKNDLIDRDDNHINNKIKKYFIHNYLEEHEIKNLYRFDMNYQTKVKPLSDCLENEYRFWNKQYYNKSKRFNNGEQSKILINAYDDVISYIKLKIEEAKQEEQNNKSTLETKYKEFLNITDQKLNLLHNERKEQKVENERVEAEKRFAKYTEIYNEALELALTEELNNIDAAIKLFNNIIDFRDSKNKIEELTVLYSNVSTYNKAIELMKSTNITMINEAKEAFSSIRGFRDSDIKVTYCTNLIDEIKVKNDKKKKLMTVIVVVSIFVCAALFIFYTSILPNMNYNSGIESLNSNDYDKAIGYFSNLNDYKDSNQLLNESYYLKAKQLLNTESYETAYEIFTSNITTYKDSQSLAKDCALAVGDKSNEVDKKIDWYNKAGRPDKIQDTKYDYVKNHYNNTDMQTYEYLKELSEDEYADSQNLYEKLYEIEYKFYLNSEIGKMTNYSKTTVNAYKDYYLNVVAQGGYPDQEIYIDVRYEFYNTSDNKWWLYKSKLITNYKISEPPYKNSEGTKYFYASGSFGTTGKVRITALDSNKNVLFQKVFNAVRGN